MTKIICIDVDGVLRPFNEQCAKVFIKHHPQFSGEEIRLVKDSRDIFLGYPVTTEYMRRFIFEEKAEDVFLNVEPYPSAKFEFHELQNYCVNNNHSLVIISSQRTYLLKRYTIDWLELNGFMTTNLMFLSYTEKYLFNGSILVDDEPGNLIPWINTGRPAACYAREWNSGWTGKFVKSLIDVIPIIEEH